MLFNIILMVLVEAVLAGMAVWSLYWNIGGSTLVICMVLLLVSWLAGILCFLAGYRMKPLASVKKELFALLLPTCCAFLLSGFTFGALAPGVTALSLPYLPLLQMVDLGFDWWTDILAFLSPLLAFAGLQIKKGVPGRPKKIGVGIMVFYLILLLVLPVVGLMMWML